MKIVGARVVLCRTVDSEPARGLFGEKPKPTAVYGEWEVSEEQLQEHAELVSRTN